MIKDEILPRLHDANISGIKSEFGVLTLSGTDDVDKPWEMTVTGVRCMVCSPFLQGNIIGTIRFHKFTKGLPDNLWVTKIISDMFFST